MSCRHKRPPRGSVSRPSPQKLFLRPTISFASRKCTSQHSKSPAGRQPRNPRIIGRNARGKVQVTLPVSAFGVLTCGRRPAEPHLSAKGNPLAGRNRADIL
jgi:hypothetical protein